MPRWAKLGLVVAVYVDHAACPGELLNHEVFEVAVLANQTREQANQFGIKYVTLDKDLPPEFLDSKAILITHAPKLFNGKSTFGTGAASEHVASIVVDDSHACIDAIRQAFIIRADLNHPVHSKLLDLFGTELEKQGVGTFQDIRTHSYDSLLSVPYWDWHGKVSDVAAVLSKHSDTKDVKFVWPLLKDMLQHCQCLISGQSFPGVCATSTSGGCRSSGFPSRAARSCPETGRSCQGSSSVGVHLYRPD